MVPALFVLVWMSVLFLFALWRKDKDVLDVAWAGGIVLAVFTAFWLRGTATPRQVLVLSLVLIWGFRLLLHIWWRNLRRPGHAPFTSFLFYGVFIFLVSSPALVVQYFPGRPLGLLDFLGAGVWTVGLTLETVAELEWVRFKQQPRNKGKPVRTGVWSLLDRPNVWGEVLVWWGLYLIALGVTRGWLSFAGPLLLSLFLLRKAHRVQKGTPVGVPSFGVMV